MIGSRIAVTSRCRLMSPADFPGEPMSIGGVCYDADDLPSPMTLPSPSASSNNFTDGKSRKTGSAPVDLFRVGHCRHLLS